ncbi:MAG: 2Fe-2S ferredoxin [Halieaceae bacterium]|jgi:2Fe-2S ferredoxin
MPEIIVTQRNGEAKPVEFSEGITLMQALCDGGIDELLAICGGICSCATCHVHIDPTSMAKLPPLTEDEDGLLFGSENRNGYSRLSCQIRLTDKHDRMRVTVAEEG